MINYLFLVVVNTIMVPDAAFTTDAIYDFRLFYEVVIVLTFPLFKDRQS